MRTRFVLLDRVIWHRWPWLRDWLSGDKPNTEN